MMMQEIMMAVTCVEKHPESLCLIDGSRISAIIGVNSFYAAIQNDIPNQLSVWRTQAIQQPDREPGRIIRLFESRDWLSPYLSSSRIIGNVKLVSTTVLLQNYAPQWVGRFDDKTFAAVVLEPGEALDAIPLPRPDEPWHVHRNYPYSQAIYPHAIGEQIVEPDNPCQLFHVYYRPHESHGVFKIEMNHTFLTSPEYLGELFAWWYRELEAPDIEEPYTSYIADRFAKEAVSVAKNALKEIARRDMGSTSFAWFFTQPYRTQ
jgi:hypothetical protein